MVLFHDDGDDRSPAVDALGVERTPDDAQQQSSPGIDTAIPQRETRRSFALGIVNGAIYRFGLALIDPPIILTWFVSQFTSINLLIGLVSRIHDAGWQLLQLFISTRVQRMERKMPMYRVGAVVRIVAWFFLVAVVWFVDDPLPLLVGFFVLYLISRLAAGWSGLPWLDIVAKTIPARRRGAFFAWRQFLGGILALGGGWIVKTILNDPTLPFPRGHALLFLLHGVATTLSSSAFAAIREPPGVALDELVTLRELMRRAGRLLRLDRVYRRFIAARLCLIVATIALPFYGIYAKNVLGAPDGMVGVYVSARTAAMLLFNLPWGRLSDTRGNRLVMRLMSLGSGLPVLLALVLVVLVELFRPQGAWLPYLAIPIFFLDGAMRPAETLIGNNYLLELVSEAQRPLYLGLTSTLFGITFLLSGTGGVLVDLFGFAGLFAVSLGLYLAGYLLAADLPEPRDERESPTRKAQDPQSVGPSHGV